MYWLKPLVLQLIIAVLAQANCAVSCVHPENGQVPPTETTSRSPENCHQSPGTTKPEKTNDETGCSHAHISTDRPTTAKFFEPVPAVLPAGAPGFSSEAGDSFVVVDFYSPSSHASASPRTVLRI
jgi:hypothetical protein